MPSSTQPQPLRRLLAMLALVLMTAAACSSAEMNDTASASSADFAADAAEPAVAFETSADDAMDGDEALFDEGVSGRGSEAANEAMTTGSTGSEAQAQLIDLGRDIIYTANLDLASTDVSGATRDAVTTVEGLGGFLFSQDTNGQNNTSRLVFKVLPAQFATTLDRLGGIGTVRNQAVSAEDVTSIVVDLRSRITTAEASVVRLRALIEEANDFEIIAQLENQLLDRETTLERLRGQLRSVENQVDLATINLSIVELQNRASVAVSLTALPLHDGGQRCSMGQGQNSITADGPTTLCLQITNRGDVTLVDLDIDQPVLGTSLEDFVLLDGTVDRLAPGMTALLIAELDVTEEVESLRTTVIARGVDADDEPAGGEARSTSPALWIQVPESDELPGFADVLAGSWNAIKTIAILIAIALVAVAPFAAVALVLAPLALWVWRRLPQRGAKAPSKPPMPAPPGPRDLNEEPVESTVSA